MPHSADTPSPLRIAAVLAVAVAGTLALVVLSLAISPNTQPGVAAYFHYQSAALGVAGVTVLAMRVVLGRSFRVLRIGHPAAPARPIPVLGVKPGESWRKVGTTFWLITCIATTGWLILAQAGPTGAPLAAWITAVALAVPLAASNALVEEIVTRWTLVEGLTGRCARVAPFASALVFGSAHYMGVPGGLSGGLMAAFLAWLISLSIQDTRGLFWAIFIHFWLDVVIFATLLADRT
ncbi:CPBP family glutamic-type intramembrane protease [Mesobacterium sp. TK19101]|uniref:CPBP family glutamic-type intramembrane protease n=1 Tax=Mesobacterium hydrothermale TaxID=3111907 RepID=A0ABU6HDL5_9RHOB|nr:CPBP family glutamic-type intramembrane protease [Mesobacterium sp. TK19101]MEC3859960.1 CPBP family glutamic-type intramembrane protease [Mesobacterium sp. TK19101]